MKLRKIDRKVIELIANKYSVAAYVSVVQK